MRGELIHAAFETRAPYQIGNGASWHLGNPVTIPAGLPRHLPTDISPASHDMGGIAVIGDLLCSILTDLLE
jgi:hypothetical protein